MFSSLQPEFFHTKLKSDFYFFCPWKISNVLQLFPKSFLLNCRVRYFIPQTAKWSFPKVNFSSLSIQEKPFHAHFFNFFSFVGFTST